MDDLESIADYVDMKREDMSKIIKHAYKKLESKDMTETCLPGIYYNECYILVSPDITLELQCFTPDFRREHDHCYMIFNMNKRGNGHTLLWHGYDLKNIPI